MTDNKKKKADNDAVADRIDTLIENYVNSIAYYCNAFLIAVMVCIIAFLSCGAVMDWIDTAGNETLNRFISLVYGAAKTLSMFYIVYNAVHMMIQVKFYEITMKMISECARDTEE